MSVGTEKTPTTNSQIRELPKVSPSLDDKQDTHGGEDRGINLLMRQIAATSGAQETPPPDLAPIFTSAEFSHPVNHAQKARALQSLQKSYGNRYLQGVLANEGEGSAREDYPVLIQRTETQAASDASRAESPPMLPDSGWQPLDRRTQESMGASFNRDFSNVRIHDDSAAHHRAKSLNARAFTTGRDIYFSQGAYNPGSESGRQLLAHELTHVVQQSGATPGLSPSGFSVSQPSDPLERQAEEVSKSVMEDARPMTAFARLNSSISPAPGSVQRFAGTEHEQLGDVTGVRDIDLGNGVVLTWGQMIALAGDYYATYQELQDDTRTAGGRARIRAMLENYGSPATNVTSLPAPTPAQRTDAEGHLVILALENVPHFSAGGTSRETWLNYHGQALEAAVTAGLSQAPGGRSGAYALEAFGQHFLTDSFSAGHVRTPRREISDWYVTVFAPRVIDRFINSIRDRFVNGIFAQVTLQSRLARTFPDRARSRIRNDLNRRIEAGIAAAGGRQVLVRWFGLLVGGAVSGTIHDTEGRRGVVVTSLARPEPWHTVGDSRLNEGSSAASETRTEAENAIRSARQDVDTAFDIAQAERAFRDTAPAPSALPDKIYFGFDHSDLTDEARTALTGAAAHLVYNPGAFVALTGHTDPVGRRSYNLNLALRRAETVLNFLTSRGVDSDRVSAISRGEEMPVTRSSRQFWRNRRVELAFGQRPVSASATHDIARERIANVVRQRIGPPYQAERFIPTAAPGQNDPLPDWHWGSLPRSLQGDIASYVTAEVRPRVTAALAVSQLDDVVDDDIRIRPRPIATAIVSELLRDPIRFLSGAFGETAGP